MRPKLLGANVLTHKILVLSKNIGNVELIRKLFVNDYHVRDQSQFDFGHELCDLIICDAFSLQEWSDWLKRDNARFGAEEEKVEIKSPLLGLLSSVSVPDHIVEQFDDTIQLPSTKGILTRRVKSLLNSFDLRKSNHVLRKKLEAQVSDLELKTAAAETANSSKSAFLANMSHEIRTPLNAILGFSDLLKDATLTEDEQGYLSVIRRNGRALTSLIDDILDLSKVEAGKLKFEQIGFSLTELIDESIELFADKANSKNLRLNFSAGDLGPLRILSDPSRLRQILINIIGNAIKFTDRGSVTISLKKEMTSKRESLIRIEVCDTGVGLTQLQAQKLFAPFIQADDSTARRYGGTGLGLMLSKRLAQGLGGDVVIKRTEVSVGTSVEISFMAEAASEQQPKQDLTTSVVAVKRSRARILLVDDSADNRLLMKSILSKQGYVVETADDGAEGVEMAIHGGFALILMDIQMPIMDGYEALSELQKLGYSGPVVALTAHAMAEERVKTRQAGFSAHLVKPIEREKMFATIEDLVGLHR